jgi:hypothetical protein
MVAKTVPAGNYVFIVTISGVGGNSQKFGGDPAVVDTFCNVRDDLGGSLAFANARGEIDVNVNTTSTLTMTGGASVPAGQSRTITAYCLVGGGTGKFDSAQILTMKVGGFGI